MRPSYHSQEIDGDGFNIKTKTNGLDSSLVRDKESGGKITNRPPAYTSSTLGGLWRLHGYPSQRFNDKAATDYAAELRLIPEVSAKSPH